jgi:hypothetical protein
MGAKSRNSCRDLFKRLEILILPCEDIFSLINFIRNNKEHFQTEPNANLSCFQKSAYYARIEIFNNLPSDLKSLTNEKAWFKITLKRHLNTHSFYSVDEYLLPKKWLIHLKVVQPKLTVLIHVNVFLNSLMCNHCTCFCIYMTYSTSYSHFD